MKTAIIVATLFATGSLAANATTISATGCVDPSSMTTCLNAAEDKVTTCLAAAGGNDDVIIACGWAQWISQMVCYQESCWNKAYSCEYQYLVTEYKAQRTVDEDIPFYPAPDNAPGGCSCNIGAVFTNVSATLDEVSTCTQYSLSVSDDLENCQCCLFSGAVSAFYGICPNTSPDGLVSIFDSDVGEYESITGSCAGLTADLCAGYGFYSADNGTFLDPANLPSGGTDALSTTAGPSSLTTPPAGATITWTALSVTYTVTASAYDASNVAASTATGSAPGAAATSGGSGGSGGATATGTAASATKTGAASTIREGSAAWAVGLLFLSGLAALL